MFLGIMLKIRSTEDERATRRVSLVDEMMEMFNINAAGWHVREWRQSGCSRDIDTSGGL